MLDRAAGQSALLDRAAGKGALLDGTSRQGALLDRAAAESKGADVGEHVDGWWVEKSGTWSDVRMLKTCGGCIEG